MTDEEGIRRTIADYAHFCDDGRFAEWGDLYAADARFSVMGKTHEGREAIQAFITNAQPPERRGKHICFNAAIDVDGDEASAITDFIFMDRTRTITTAGRYHDRLVRDGSQWRFADRRIVFMSEDA